MEMIISAVTRLFKLLATIIGALFLQLAFGFCAIAVVVILTIDNALIRLAGIVILAVVGTIIYKRMNRE